MRSFDAAKAQVSLFDALVAAARKHGLKKPILEDQERKPLTYLELIRASFALGRKVAALTERGEHVGVMLPSTAGGVVTFFALHAFGRVPRRGDQTTLDGLEFRVLRAAKRRIELLRVVTPEERRLPGERAPDESAG